jgi:hypothetical protein
MGLFSSAVYSNMFSQDVEKGVELFHEANGRARYARAGLLTYSDLSTDSPGLPRLLAHLHAADIRIPLHRHICQREYCSRM